MKLTLSQDGHRLWECTLEQPLHSAPGEGAFLYEVIGALCAAMDGAMEQARMRPAGAAAGKPPTPQ